MPIHPTAIVNPKAQLDSTVEVGPYCVIDEHVRVAAGCRLYHGVYLTGWTTIGEDCVLHPGAIVGHEPQDIKYAGERTFCRIGARTILREYVTVHRGTTPESETVVGEDCLLFTGTHVGHNCRVGDAVTLISPQLAGHVSVEDRVSIGGGAGIHQFVRVGRLAMIKGNAAVGQDVPPFSLIDTDGRVAGLNQVGLRRAELPPEEILELRRAFRTLYGRGVPFRKGVERLVATAEGEAARHLAQFVQSDSRRGIAGRSRR